LCHCIIDTNIFRAEEHFMTMRGIRGATTVSADDVESVHAATRELILAILEANPTLRPTDIASVFFTVTDDIHSTYPATGARTLGGDWMEVPLMCAREIPVQGSLPGAVRVLIHWNTELSQHEIHHVYLHGAIALRPDIAQKAKIG
jgi:chorismate mutase